MILLCECAGQKSKLISSAALKPTTVVAKWAAEKAFGSAYQVKVITVFSHDTHVFTVKNGGVTHRIITGKKGSK